MNELTKELQEIPVPRAVLVAYKYEDGPMGKDRSTIWNCVR